MIEFDTHSYGWGENVTDEFSLHEKTSHCMLVVAFTSKWKLSGKFTTWD